MMVAAAPALLASLFLTWSHQFSPSLLARYGGSSMLRGVPHDPNAWQVYSIVDGLLVALAAALVVFSRIGTRVARVVLAGFVLIALAFVVHAVKKPPTDGANIFEPNLSAPAYVPNTPRSGSGEVLALAALGIAIGGIALSLAVETD
jgi:hypothetical protein